MLSQRCEQAVHVETQRPGEVVGRGAHSEHLAEPPLACLALMQVTLEAPGCLMPH